MSILALEYRPRTLRELTGQRVPQAVLMNALHERAGTGADGSVLWTPRAEPQVPAALLLAGQRGCGKTSAARIVAAALNCEAPGERPCTACTSCQAVENGRSLAVTEIDAASNGGVAEIRKLRELVSYATADGPYRVVILDECHSMSKDAYNALLKLLEEPPEHTVFILLTTEDAKILPTVVSRCMRLTFRRIAVPDIQARLRQICTSAGITAQDDLLAELASRADGAMRDAVMTLDQCRSAGVTTLGAYQYLHGETDFAPELLSACIAGDHAGVFRCLDTVLSERADFGAISAALVACLRDVLVLTAGGEVTAQGQALDSRQALSHRLGADRATAAMRVLWDLRTRTQGDARSSLELALVMISEKVAVPRVTIPAAPAAAVTGNGHQPLSLDQLAAMARG